MQCHVYRIYAGLHAANWVVRRDPDDQTAWLISNQVTDAANASSLMPPPGTPKTFLQHASEISSGGYYLQVVVCSYTESESLAPEFLKTYDCTQ